jgi:hypothetical protein
VEAWPGFKATACHYQVGYTIVVDNITKFMSTKTCLDRIYELRSNRKIRNVEAVILNEFVGHSIIANWGNKRTYIVDDVIFDANPCNKFFMGKDDKKVSVAQYFEKTY